MSAGAETERALAERLAALDIETLRQRFFAQDEALIIEDFLPAPLLKVLLASLPSLRGNINRNYLPGHKKGGSISRFDLDRLAPQFPALYKSPALEGLPIGFPLMRTPPAIG